MFGATRVPCQVSSLFASEDFGISFGREPSRVDSTTGTITNHMIRGIAIAAIAISIGAKLTKTSSKLFSFRLPKQWSCLTTMKSLSIQLWMGKRRARNRIYLNNSIITWCLQACARCRTRKYIFEPRPTKRNLPTDSDSDGRISEEKN